MNLETPHPNTRLETNDTVITFETIYQEFQKLIGFLDEYEKQEINDQGKKLSELLSQDNLEFNDSTLKLLENIFEFILEEGGQGNFNQVPGRIKVIITKIRKDIRTFKSQNSDQKLSTTDTQNPDQRNLGKSTIKTTPRTDPKITQTPTLSKLSIKNLKSYFGLDYDAVQEVILRFGSTPASQIVETMFRELNESEFGHQIPLSNQEKQETITLIGYFQSLLLSNTEPVGLTAESIDKLIVQAQTLHAVLAPLQKQYDQISETVLETHPTDDPKIHQNRTWKSYVSYILINLKAGLEFLRITKNMAVTKNLLVTTSRSPLNSNEKNSTTLSPKYESERVKDFVESGNTLNILYPEELAQAIKEVRRDLRRQDSENSRNVSFEVRTIFPPATPNSLESILLKLQLARLNPLISLYQQQELQITSESELKRAKEIYIQLLHALLKDNALAKVFSKIKKYQSTFYQNLRRYYTSYKGRNQFPGIFYHENLGFMLPGSTEFFDSVLITEIAFEADSYFQIVSKKSPKELAEKDMSYSVDRAEYVNFINNLKLEVSNILGNLSFILATFSTDSHPKNSFANEILLEMFLYLRAQYPNDLILDDKDALPSITTLLQFLEKKGISIQELKGLASSITRNVFYPMKANFRDGNWYYLVARPDLTRPYIPGIEYLNQESTRAPNPVGLYPHLNHRTINGITMSTVELMSPLQDRNSKTRDENDRNENSNVLPQDNQPTVNHINREQETHLNWVSTDQLRGMIEKRKSRPNTGINSPQSNLNKIEEDTSLFCNPNHLAEEIFDPENSPLEIEDTDDPLDLDSLDRRQLQKLSEETSTVILEYQKLNSMTLRSNPSTINLKYFDRLGKTSELMKKTWYYRALLRINEVYYPILKDFGDNQIDIQPYHFQLLRELNLKKSPSTITPEIFPEGFIEAFSIPTIAEENNKKRNYFIGKFSKLIFNLTLILEKEINHHLDAIPDESTLLNLAIQIANNSKELALLDNPNPKDTYDLVENIKNNRELIYKLIHGLPLNLGRIHYARPGFTARFGKRLLEELIKKGVYTLSLETVRELITQHKELERHLDRRHQKKQLLKNLQEILFLLKKNSANTNITPYTKLHTSLTSHYEKLINALQPIQITDSIVPFSGDYNSNDDIQNYMKQLIPIVEQKIVEVNNWDISQSFHPAPHQNEAQEY